jgi:hypothetical protein
MQKLADECKRNLLKFYYTFIALRFENTTSAPHLLDLADKLTQCVYNPEFKNRLCVSMPPQHSKSSMVTVAFATWLIIREPHKRILIVNAEKELSKTFGIQIRQLIHNIGHYYGIEVSNVQSSNTSLMFTKHGELCDGSIKLTGASGGITGRPADIIIVDDPYKGLEDEFTPTQLNKKWNWYSSLIEQRARNQTKLIVMHTRWHSEDIQGRIQADDYQSSKYHFVEYPAIDEDNKPLWDYYGLEFYLDKQRTMGERQFQAIYQQKPLDLTSDFFHVDRLIFDDTFDDYPIARCRSWDIASSDDSLGDQRDYTAGVRMLKTPSDHYWIFPYERGQYGNNVKNVIRDTARLDGAAYTILLEPGTSGGAAGLFYEEYKNNLTGYNTVQSLPKGTKADRATPLANAIYDGKVHICIRNDTQRQTLLDEFKSFPNGKHDDLVDAVAYGYNWLSKHGDNHVGTSGKRRRAKI